MRRFNVVSRGRQSDYQRRTNNDRLAHLHCSLWKGGTPAPLLWCCTESDANIRGSRGYESETNLNPQFADEARFTPIRPGRGVRICVPDGPLLMSTADACRLVRFGAFELDLDGGVLSRSGRRVPLQEQPARILTLLVSRPDEVVTREELLATPRVDGRHLRRIRREPERRHHQDSSRTQGFRERSPLHRDRSEAWLPLSRRRAGASASVGVNGRRYARSRRSSFSAVGRRTSTGAAGRPSSAPDRVTGNRGRDTSLRLAALSRTRATSSRAARAVAHGAALRDASRGNAPESGSELAAAIGGRLGRLHTLTVKPWPPGAAADPRAVGRELGVDARLSGVATRTGQQLSIALRIVSTDGERALWEDVVAVPVSDLMWLESQIAQRVGTALASR